VDFTPDFGHSAIRDLTEIMKPDLVKLPHFICHKLVFSLEIEKRDRPVLLSRCYLPIATFYCTVVVK
jgi:hypothetical protein